MDNIKGMVSTALANQPFEQVDHLGLDETSSKKGHNYLTIQTDVKRKKVIGVGQGKNRQAVDDALVDMEVRGANRENIKVITMDM